MGAKLGTVLFETAKLTMRQLSELPQTPSVAALREEVNECFDELETWNTTPPTAAARTVLINKVLRVHMAVRELGKNA